MRNKTFKCPYLTEEDKEFLKYEMRVYKENFKKLLRFHKGHEKLLTKTDKEAENYENAQYSALCFNAGSDVFYALSMTHVHFVNDICNYFYCTRDIEELDMEVSDCCIREETEMLTLDEVFDKYVRQFLEGKE